MDNNNPVGSCNILELFFCLFGFFCCCFVCFCFSLKDGVWLIRQRKHCVAAVTTSFTVQCVFLSTCCWISPSLFSHHFPSCTTIKMDLFLNVKSFSFLACWDDLAGFYPCFYQFVLIYRWRKKKKRKKKSFLFNLQSQILVYYLMCTITCDIINKSIILFY